MTSYINEFTFHLSAGNVRRHSLERLDSALLGTIGKHMTYSELIK